MPHPTTNDWQFKPGLYAQDPDIQTLQSTGVRVKPEGWTSEEYFRWLDKSMYNAGIPAANYIGSSYGTSLGLGSATSTGGGPSGESGLDRARKVAALYEEHQENMNPADKQRYEGLIKGITTLGQAGPGTLPSDRRDYQLAEQELLRQANTPFNIKGIGNIPGTPQAGKYLQEAQANELADQVKTFTAERADLEKNFALLSEPAQRTLTRVNERLEAVSAHTDVRGTDPRYREFQENKLVMQIKEEEFDKFNWTNSRKGPGPFEAWEDEQNVGTYDEQGNKTLALTRPKNPVVDLQNGSLWIQQSLAEPGKVVSKSTWLADENKALETQVTAMSKNIDNAVAGRVSAAQAVEGAQPVTPQMIEQWENEAVEAAVARHGKLLSLARQKQSLPPDMVVTPEIVKDMERRSEAKLQGDAEAQMQPIREKFAKDQQESAKQAEVQAAQAQAALTDAATTAQWHNDLNTKRDGLEKLEFALKDWKNMPALVEAVHLATDLPYGDEGVRAMSKAKPNTIMRKSTGELFYIYRDKNTGKRMALPMPNYGTNWKAKHEAALAGAGG